MKLVLKLFGYLLGLAVLVLVLAAIAIPLFVDPNDFKGPLTKLVQDRTGRTLSIDGEMGLSVFPWLGVEVTGVTLGNAPGFPEPVFAGAERADVRVKLMPLLKRAVELDTITLHGLTVHLARDGEGRGNWEDLATPREGPRPTPDEAPAAAPASPAFSLTALAVGGLDIRDARVDWNDAQANQRYLLDGLDLKTGSIAAGRPVAVELAFRLESQRPELAARVKLDATVDGDPQARRYGLREFKLSALLEGEGLPAQPTEVVLIAEADLDLDRQTLSVPGFRLTGLGLNAEGAANVDKVLEAPAYNASVKLTEFNGRDLLERLGGGPLNTADGAALTRVHVNTRVRGDASRLRLDPLTVRLDDTNLEGHLELADFTGPAVRFDLAVDTLNLDRYLPPPAAGAPPASPATGAAAAAALPLEALRPLDLDGRLRVGKLLVAKLTLNDIVLKLTGKNGVVTLHPATAQLYGGRYSGNLRLDAGSRTPRLSVDEKLHGVQAGPLLRDLVGEERLQGRAELAARLTATGQAAEALTRSLNGDARVAFLDGAVKGINIGRLLREAKAALEGKRLPPDEGPQQTDFSEITASFRITDGVLRNEDLLGKSPLLRVTGRGSADLVQQRLDYLLTATVVGTSKGQGGRELEELQGLPIPVRIVGSFDRPEYKVDLEEVLKSQAKKKIEEKVQEKLQKQLEDKGGAPVQDLLRGLFR